MFLRASAFIAVGCFAAGQTPPPRNFLNEGIAAYKNARYAEAVDLFQQAADAAPSDPVPRMYLGTAWMSQFVPGSDNPDHLRAAANAEREFQSVLNLQPDNQLALESLASLNYQGAQGNRSQADKLRALDEAAYWYQKLVTAHPNHKTGYYSLGVIAWAKYYPQLMQARHQLGMQPQDPGPLRDPAVRAEVRSRLGPLMDEGIRNLERALELDPRYDDAMAYLNLIHRGRADLQESDAEYQREVQTADILVQRALQTKKEKAMAAQPGGPQGSVTVMPVGPRPATFGIGSGGTISATPVTGTESSTGAQPAVPKQIRVGAVVQEQKLVYKPEPVYPPTAREARIQGTVRYNAVIGKDGTIANLTLVSGHPLLVPSATEAVRRYRYQPTLLNGEPVEVVTQIDVPLVLSQ